MSKPTEKFSFNGNFSVGGAPSGENENAIAVYNIIQILRYVY